MRALAIAALGLVVLACNPQQARDIEEIKKNQKDILAKLDTIARSGGRPAAPQQPQGPDPAKTYAFPTGDSPAKGPADAWVTIVEVSDFQ